MNLDNAFLWGGGDRMKTYEAPKAEIVAMPAALGAEGSMTD